MSVPVAPTCGNCNYWLSSDGKMGQCLRYPPVCRDVESSPDIAKGRFPLCLAQWWCGEWSKILPNKGAT